MSRGLNPAGFRSLASVKHVVNVGTSKTETNSCGIARFPCDIRAFLLNFDGFKLAALTVPILYSLHHRLVTSAVTRVFGIIIFQ